MPDDTDSLRQARNFRILGGAAVLILAVGGVIAFIFANRAGDDQNSGNRSNTNAAPLSTFDARQGIPQSDADSDGLTDAEEEKLGLNPTLNDSDRDELTDFDEVKLYHSDPKKADSDGDGNSDGTEVKKGFSPTGSGRLFDTSPAATTNATP